MSNQKKSDEEELLAEFERMLSEGGFNYDEEDFGFYCPPTPTRFNPHYDSDFGSTEPPEIPREAKCKHERRRKEGITKVFWICEDCKKDLGDA